MCVSPNVGGSEKSRLWVGIGGSEKNRGCDIYNWNIKQSTLQQMLKVTTFCTHTWFQSFSPLINCIVHQALLKFSPCRNKTLPQLVRRLLRIDTWYAWKMNKMKNLCNFLQNSGATFFRCSGLGCNSLFSSEITQIIWSIWIILLKNDFLDFPM